LRFFSRRRNGLRRELRHSDPAATRVNEVAHRRGFWHMGQLAADYRRWFGELPSDTLARS
jgi:AraC family ethanolamine operon transcriptional activator